jgi:hypothetical protein
VVLLLVADEVKNVLRNLLHRLRKFRLAGIAPLYPRHECFKIDVIVDRHVALPCRVPVRIYQLKSKNGWQRGRRPRGGRWIGRLSHGHCKSITSTCLRLGRTTACLSAAMHGEAFPRLARGTR